ncbi:MAG: hypothetical protein FWG73_04520 [Planctomycetaceae bacterium]|nr:hypothetical protein [Planctomycetaceae bacterium]
MNNVAYSRKFASRQCLLVSICVLLAGGCGTTKWSDTSRTGTEQLLVSNAIDRVVDKIDFSPMQDKKCFLNTAAIENTTDRNYLAMTVRQHLATAGAVLAENEEDADYIVEIRAGAVGTDRDDLLVGIPATTLPAFPGSQYSATSIPEIPFVKRTKQRGVAKIALFAYNKDTGRPVWTSGNRQGESAAQNFWFAGAGPLTRGTIYHEPTFAGNSLPRSMQKTVRMQPNLTLAPERPQVFPESMPIPETVQTPNVPVPTYPMFLQQ